MVRSLSTEKTAQLLYPSHLLHLPVYIMNGTRYTLVTILILCSTLFAGCEVVEFIFKAGMVVGILLIVGIVALVAFIMRRMRR